jgi:hypothetical protein
MGLEATFTRAGMTLSKEELEKYTHGRAESSIPKLPDIVKAERQAASGAANIEALREKARRRRKAGAAASVKGKQGVVPAG